MISRALLNAPFFIPKDADLLRNRKVNTKKRQNRHLPELAFLILGTYFTAPFCFARHLLHDAKLHPIFQILQTHTPAASIFHSERPDYPHPDNFLSVFQLFLLPIQLHFPSEITGISFLRAINFL